MSIIKMQYQDADGERHALEVPIGTLSGRELRRETRAAREAEMRRRLAGMLHDRMMMLELLRTQMQCLDVVARNVRAGSSEADR